MPHRLNTLICAVLCLGVSVQFVSAQTSAPRPASGGVRPAAKKSTIPGEAPAASVPKVAREPVGRAVIGDEPAEPAAPRQPALRPRPPAAQGPAPPQQPAQGPAPQVAFLPVTPEMMTVLKQWEAKTKGFTSLQCPVTRIEFDKVFAYETRSNGVVYFENPDHGRIDFDPANKDWLAKPGRVAAGKVYKVGPGSRASWICTGKQIFVLDPKAKTYDLIDIPSEMQGQNITRSPLPFIFGMKVQDAINRFNLSFGPYHDPEGKLLGKNGKLLPTSPAIHVIACPFDPNVVKEYTQAEILLDPVTFLPKNLRTLDPSGNKETVYSFDQNQIQVGVVWKKPLIGERKTPFDTPSLSGWQLIHHHKAEPDQPPVRQAKGIPK